MAITGGNKLTERLTQVYHHILFTMEMNLQVGLFSKIQPVAISPVTLTNSMQLFKVCVPDITVTFNRSSKTKFQFTIIVNLHTSTIFTTKFSSYIKYLHRN